ncbi:MAG: DUF3426 domain-containing protein [Acidovorax sp.]|nr:DUF3426 domain-containing protein [Acidovorax sp.]
MSQITRCPSCATSFKVVADQLRISEGWVRCGQCKEVFDASAHLLPVAPSALLPDVSLTDVRPPPAPVVRKAEVARGWGAAPAATAARPHASVWGAGSRETSGGKEMPPAPSLATGARYADAAPSVVRDVPAAAATPVLEIPSPAVPAFLAAGAGVAVSGEDPLSLSTAAPFAWQSLLPSLRAEPAVAEDSLPLREAEAVAAASPGVIGEVDAADTALLTPGVVRSPALAPLADATKEVLSGGYELPSADLADLHDSGWHADLVAPEADVAAEAVEAVVGSEGASLALEIPALQFLPVPPSDIAPVAPMPSEPVVGPAPDVLPSVDFVQPSVVEASVALELVADDSPVAALQARPRLPACSPAEVDGAEDDETHDADQEVSFVVAARRKAFWRKPLVRGVLVLGVLLLTLGLVVQMVVQERDRISAMDARARPWLLSLCEPLRCEIAPQRQIADVVIDSSSFNKARGDSYLLAFAMKSKADIPLAMPAVELTLTDAQDQPVLRRVLLPADMAAQAELLARGEWSTSVSVIVTTGGARVAGYRLLAFYP